MGHGGYTLELSLKDSVSAGLKDMGRALSNVRELVGSLRADVSALNKESGQAVSGLDLGKLAEGAADQLEGLSKGALQELDAAFRDSGKTMADYYAERRRQAGETADMERENASEQAERMAQELEARKDAYQAELEAFVAHGQNWVEAQQAQADREVSIKAEQAEREKAIDAQRLEGALSLAGGMADAMKQVYESGLAQSKGVYQLYQALAIAEATISKMCIRDRILFRPWWFRLPGTSPGIGSPGATSATPIPSVSVTPRRLIGCATSRTARLAFPACRLRERKRRGPCCSNRAPARGMGWRREPHADGG